MGPLVAAALALALLTLSPGARAAADPIGIGAAADELRAALVTLDATFNGLPATARELLAADVKLLGQTIDSTLARIEQPAVPLVDEGVVHDLAFLTDIMVALTTELQSTDGDGAALGRIDGLSQLAVSRLDQLDATADQWLARTRSAVLRVDNDGGTIVVRAIDRVLYATIRYAGVVLLLMGLLLVGLQLLRVSVEPGDRLVRLRAAPVGAAIGLGTLGLFFLGALGLAIFPSSLAGLSAAREILPQEHPCQRLGAQRTRLRLAQGLGHSGLIEASKRRMLPATADGLGMPNALAAAAAVEQLAMRSAATLDSGWDRGTPAVSAAPTTASSGVGGPRAARSDLPAAEGALDELLASLRQTEGELAASIAAAPAPAPTAAAASADEPTLVTAPDEEAAAAAAGLASPLGGPSPGAGPPATEPPVTEPRRYLVTAGLNYREAPNTGARRLGILRPGVRITVLGLSDGWAEIELDDGRRAYASSAFLRPSP